MINNIHSFNLKSDYICVLKVGFKIIFNEIKPNKRIIFDNKNAIKQMVAIAKILANVSYKSYFCII